MTEMTQVNPREQDKAEARLWDELAEHTRAIQAQEGKLHRMARDRRVGFSRRASWQLSLPEVIARLHDRSAWAKRDLSYGCSPQEAVARLDELNAQADAAREGIATAEALWREHGWSRFILCLSTNGHIHNYHGCPTLNRGQEPSLLEWHPEFSGQTVDEAVQALGPILCQVCFPEAKAEYKRDPAACRRERDAGQRAAEKAGHEAVKAIKKLRPEEQFRNHRGDRVTTVAACKQALRDEVEFRDYYGSGQHSYYAKAQAAAEMAARVLLAREQRQPGTGATQEEIGKIIARAIVRNRKEGARI
jgi:hypothetical protein